MGYFKNLQIELEEIHDDELREIVAWDHAHRHLLDPTERWQILTNEVKLKRALVLWQNGDRVPAPVPASAHVALQVSRRALRQPRKSYRCLVGWSLIGVALVTGVALLVVML